MAVNSVVVLDLNRAGLRRFGYTTGAIVVVLFGVILPWALERAFPLWPWILSSTLFAWATVAPESMRRLYQAWMYFGHAVSRVTTPIILALVFFVVVTPTGLIRRSLRRHSLAIDFDEKASTYRVNTIRNPTSLRRPF